MACIECGNSDDEPVTIAYTDDTTELVTLCAMCRSAFEEGVFVTEVSIENRQSAERV